MNKKTEILSKFHFSRSKGFRRDFSDAYTDSCRAAEENSEAGQGSGTKRLKRQKQKLCQRLNDQNSGAGSRRNEESERRARSKTGFRSCFHAARTYKAAGGHSRIRNS